MIRTKLFLAASMMALSGCGSYSFAPPEVSLSHRAGGQSVAQNCLAPANGTAIPENVDGALALVHNFIDAYRCTMRIAADGRQAFQLPGFTALVGSTLAVALGGGQDWAIAGGAASSMFTAGNSYYAPQEQTMILRDALDALACIQSEAVGVSAFSRAPRATATVAAGQVEAAEAAAEGADQRAAMARDAVAEATAHTQRAASDAAAAETRAAQFDSAPALAADAPRRAEARTERDAARAQVASAQEELRGSRGDLTDALQARSQAYAALAQVQAEAAISTIEVTPEQQYFNMVSAALLGVEIVAAQRLSARGTFDPAGVRAQIQDLAEQEQKARDNLPETPAPPTGPGSGSQDATNAFAPANADARVGRAIDRVQWVQLHLDLLQPKLQQCILRAQV